MPTEVRKPNFKPEGRIVLVDIIPDSREVDKQNITHTQMNGSKLEKVEVEVKTIKDEKTNLYLPAKSREDRTAKGVLCAKGSLVEGYDEGDIVVYKPNPQSCAFIEVEGHLYMMMEQYNLVGKYTN